MRFFPFQLHAIACTEFLRVSNFIGHTSFRNAEGKIVNFHHRPRWWKALVLQVSKENSLRFQKAFHHCTQGTIGLAKILWSSAFVKFLPQNPAFGKNHRKYVEALNPRDAIQRNLLQLTQPPEYLCQMPIGIIPTWLHMTIAEGGPSALKQDAQQICDLFKPRIFSHASLRSRLPPQTPSPRNNRCNRSDCLHPARHVRRVVANPHPQPHQHGHYRNGSNQQRPHGRHSLKSEPFPHCNPVF